MQLRIKLAEFNTGGTRMDFVTIVKQYGTMGAGGLAIVVLVWLLIYLVTKIDPLLNQIRKDNESHKEVVKNNTEAIKEISRSNQNVAQALTLLEHSFSSFVKIMEKHDMRAESIENEIIRIRENTRNCNKN